MSTEVPAPRAGLHARALMLFVNFMLVILAYYQVKSASRSLLLEFGGADAFPWVWSASAVTLFAFVGVYNRLVAHFQRIQVVLGSLLGFAALLVLFRLALDQANTASVVMFYIFVDLFSVVLVEQFWSLANSVTAHAEGRKSYWFIASGGLVGGVLGGLVSAALIRHTSLTTVDLLLSCAALLVVAAIANFFMSRHQLLSEVPGETQVKLAGEGLKAVLANRYLVLIALVVCISQLVEPIVEFQFLRAIEAAFSDTDQRTAYIGDFFGVLGMIAIAINVVITPVVHRHWGQIAGLCAQPLCIALASSAYAVSSNLTSAAAMKISDRGLSYSINRASKEILFVPVDPLLTYQAKAWIDMLGYRMFKVLGSAMIVIVTGSVSATAESSTLVGLTLGLCAIWLLAVFWLGQEHNRLLSPPPASRPPPTR